MKSHTCEFEPRDLLKLVLAPLLVPALFAGLLHLGVAARALPLPRPTLDTDRTILIHQADASRRAQSAEILLVGDSSCLMDVSAKRLYAKLGQPVLNLGNLSYLDVTAQGIFVREFVRANPSRLKLVVLLTHPEALRRIGSEPYQLSVLTNYLGGRDPFKTQNWNDCVSTAMGLEIFRGRVLARALPTPLGGPYGRFYGCSSDLERFMSDNLGNAVDPEVVAISGSAELRLSPSLENAASEFRASIPAGAKLVVGLTPVPEKLTGATFSIKQRQLLDQWSAWLKANGVLNQLPGSLPDDQFARSTHLRPEAVNDYSDTLAAELRPYLLQK